MKRRRIISVLPVWVAVSTGCVSSRGDTPNQENNRKTMGTYHAVGPILENIEVDKDESYVELFSTAQDLRDRFPREERLTKPEELDAFVQKTEFDESYLAVVIWQGAPRTSKLVLDDIQRSEDSIHFEIHSEPRGDSQTRDIGIHSLLIRVDRDDGDVPENATVTVEGPER